MEALAAKLGDKVNKSEQSLRDNVEGNNDKTRQLAQ